MRRLTHPSGSRGPLSWRAFSGNVESVNYSTLKTAFLLSILLLIHSVMATPASSQEVVLRLDDETMQRLIVGVADHLRDATANQLLTQPQDQTATSTSGNLIGEPQQYRR